MKTLLVELDSTYNKKQNKYYPNLAIEKLKIAFPDYELIRNVDPYDHMLLNGYKYSSIWVSCIFKENKKKAMRWQGMHKNVKIGGSGVSLNINLPDNINKINPLINMGFTTRGCCRRCNFCDVHKKEKMEIIGDIYDIWDRKSKNIILMDNNILAFPDHFIKISKQIIKEDLKVDFNQGIDIRLLTDETAKILKSMKNKMIRFAFDDIGYKNKVLKGIELINKYNLKQPLWYVYTDGDFNDVMERLMILKSANQRAYLMRDRKLKGNKKFIALAKWVNIQSIFYKMEFKEFLKTEHAIKRKYNLIKI